MFENVTYGPSHKTEGWISDQSGLSVILPNEADIHHKEDMLCHIAQQHN